VILAVPTPALDEVLTDLASDVDGKVVIDATNPVSPDFLPPTGTSAAEKIQTRLPKAHVVKAFNTAFASRQAEPDVNGEPTDGFRGRRQRSRQEHGPGPRRRDRLPTRGCRAAEHGALLEAIALLGISLQIRNGGNWQSGWKIVEPAAKAA